jgi:hypothetical protein
MVKGVGVSSMSKQVSIILFFGFSLILESSCFGNVFLMLFLLCRSANIGSLEDKVQARLSQSQPATESESSQRTLLSLDQDSGTK